MMHLEQKYDTLLFLPGKTSEIYRFYKMMRDKFNLALVGTMYIGDMDYTWPNVDNLAKLTDKIMANGTTMVTRVDAWAKDFLKFNETFEDSCE